jgi:hypothetical protein
VPRERQGSVGSVSPRVLFCQVLLAAGAAAGCRQVGGARKRLAPGRARVCVNFSFCEDS